MRNKQRTVKGKWKLPFNILSTNCGEFVVYNYRGYYHIKEECYWVIQSNEKNEYYIQHIVKT